MFVDTRVNFFSFVLVLFFVVLCWVGFFWGFFGGGGLFVFLYRIQSIDYYRMRPFFH
jgi:hypothetical protein